MTDDRLTTLRTLYGGDPTAVELLAEVDRLRFEVAVKSDALADLAARLSAALDGLRAARRAWDDGSYYLAIERVDAALAEATGRGPA